MTHAEPLVALSKAAPDAAGEVLVLSPAVGILQGLPAEQDEVAAGRPFARIRILDGFHPLLLPAGISGVVTRLEAPGTGRDAIPVEYGQPIFTLAPAGGSRRRSERAASKPAAGQASGELPPGSHAVLCPADGVFYRRPRPADPPYVEAGSRVQAGQTLALIEAMKSFSAISYGGAGLPEIARVIEIRAEDSSEVRHGQILFVVEAE